LIVFGTLVRLGFTESLCRRQKRQKNKETRGASSQVLQGIGLHHGTLSSVRVFVDFDGTVSVGDTTDLILEAFADPSWKTIEADWVAGRIGSRECLARQIDLVRASPAALDAFAHDAMIDPHFAGFTALCGAYGLPMTIVSDGLDRIATAMLARAGLRIPVVANHLEWQGGRRWRLGFPHAREDCHAAAGNCKCATLAAAPDTLRVLVGDGRSDFCAAAGADLVIAKGSLGEHCRRSGIAYEPFANFADASAILARGIGVLGRRPARPAEEPVHASPTA
jgi:2-hydroxy-3-keto-5-methylthiopentenyl-1-phosphate phosphatase